MNVVQLTLDDYLNHYCGRHRRINCTCGRRRYAIQDYESTYRQILNLARHILRDCQSDRFFPHHLAARGVPWSERYLQKRILPNMVELGLIERVDQRRGYRLLA